MDFFDKQIFVDNTVKELLNNKDKNRIFKIIESINKHDPDIINLTVSDNFKGQQINLFGAALISSPELVRHFIINKFPIDFNWTNQGQLTLLTILIKGGHKKLLKEDTNYLIEQCKHLVDIKHNGHNAISYALTAKNIELANKLLPFYEQHWAISIKKQANNILRDNLIDHNLGIIKFYAKTIYPFINDSDILKKVDYMSSSSHYNKNSFFDYIQNNYNNDNNFFEQVVPLFFKMGFDPKIYFNNKDSTFSLSQLINSNNYNINNIKQFLSIMPEFKESDKDRAFYLSAIFNKIENKNDYFDLGLDKIHYKNLSPIDFILNTLKTYQNKNSYNIINNCMDIIIDLFKHKKINGSQITYDYSVLYTPEGLISKRDIKICKDSEKTVYQSFLDSINNLTLYYYSKEENHNIFNKFELLLLNFMKDKKTIITFEDSKEPNFINIYKNFYNKNQVMSESTFNIFSYYLKKISLPVDSNKTFKFIVNHTTDEQLTSLVKYITRTQKQKLSLYYLYERERNDINKNQYEKMIYALPSEDIKFLIDSLSYKQLNLEQLYLKKIIDEKQYLANNLNTAPKQPKNRL